MGVRDAPAGFRSHLRGAHASQEVIQDRGWLRLEVAILPAIRRYQEPMVHARRLLRLAGEQRLALLVLLLGAHQIVLMDVDDVNRVA
jgi:hypothetical protein